MDYYTPFDIIVVKNRCLSSPEKCSHLCLLTPEGFSCACPERAQFRDPFTCDAGIKNFLICNSDRGTTIDKHLNDQATIYFFLIYCFVIVSILAWEEEIPDPELCVCYNGGTCVVINGTESCQCPSGKFFKTEKKYYFGSLIV